MLPGAVARAGAIRAVGSVGGAARAERIGGREALAMWVPLVLGCTTAGRPGLPHRLTQTNRYGKKY